MGAIVVAIMVGLFAVGLVTALVVMSALVIAGLKVINVAHDGSSRLINYWHRRPTH
ncbi:hypothetical protein [Haloactinomyces albus]|uniref:Energy-converting hydrogenase Eha subunit B n=1 Tax=Haloactinomyces albus TaxID=1352928 RepID=A0AAE4CLS1_9ACTN|nr:hypothetical protein [Haloactinomyces albus]MDR7302515.1 energy-converting hydrogenase Eha subunit B [Haloactinomyces albus]